MRRMILPLRVLGSTSVKRMLSGLAMGPDFQNNFSCTASLYN